MKSPGNDPGAGSIGRFVSALGYALAGFRYAVLHETAIRRELIALAILVPVSAVLPVSDVEHLLLVLPMMLVVLVELVNSSIESVVNRISLEQHPLSGQAKDLASAAVGVAVMMWGLCWLVIVGPVLVRWIRR